MDTSPYRGHGTISTPCIRLAVYDQPRRKWECRSRSHLGRGVVTKDRRSAFGQATLSLQRGEAIDVQVIVNR
ncbi:hypothetical protein BT69DRAFT_1284682 [Atractiella rhizophila]|nr:hypothetical protein BT69DRAFT_1284682 [Atractiella rhizophila]